MSQNATPPPGPSAHTIASPPAAPAKQRNMVGVVALCLSIVGTVLALFPITAVLGWIALPIAFVLGIVAVCLKGRAKGTGIAAIITAVVGTIIGVIAFTVMAAGAVVDAIDDARGGETVVVTESEAVDDSAASEAEDETEESGTRDHPLPFGSTIENANWSITLNGFDGDATDEVARDGLAATDLEDGQAWALLDATATYTGDDSGNTMELRFAFVGSDGTVYNSYEAIVAGLDGTFDPLAELYPGGSESGLVTMIVPADLDGTLRVTAGLLSDDLFFELP